MSDLILKILFLAQDLWRIKNNINGKNFSVTQKGNI